MHMNNIIQNDSVKSHKQLARIFKSDFEISKTSFPLPHQSHRHCLPYFSIK